MTVHRLWVEVHYVMPIEWDSEHDERAKAIKEAIAYDSGSIAELLPEHTVQCDEIQDAWLDVLEGRIDGIYERAIRQVNDAERGSR